MWCKEPLLRRTRTSLSQPSQIFYTSHQQQHLTIGRCRGTITCRVTYTALRKGDTKPRIQAPPLRPYRNVSAFLSSRSHPTVAARTICNPSERNVFAFRAVTGAYRTTGGEEPGASAHHVKEDNGVEDAQQRALAPLVPEVVPRVLHADGLRGLLGLVARERQLLVGLHLNSGDFEVRPSKHIACISPARVICIRFKDFSYKRPRNCLLQRRRRFSSDLRGLLARER